MRDVVKRTKLTENCSKKTIKKYVDEVIQELTLDEKISVMSGQVTEKKLLDDLFLIEHYNVKPYPTKAVERLGIPNIRFVDRTKRCCCRILPPAFLFLWQEVPALTVIWKRRLEK